MAVIEFERDFVMQHMHVENLDTTLGTALYGFNSNLSKRFVHQNKINMGYTFFTRPQLNLSPHNIRFSRQLFGFLGSEHKTDMSTFVKHTLDPRLAASKAAKGVNIINNRQAYIPILSNTLNSLSGAPDLELPSFTGEEGRMNETYTIPDGHMNLFSSVDLSATFANISGDPVLNLIHTWSLAISLMTQGLIRPYVDFITENERCYDTRIFRFTLDSSGEYITDYAATGPGFVDGIGIGSTFDYNRDSDFNDSITEHNIRFKMAGMEYRDPILLYEFNAIGEIFNPMLKDKYRKDNMVRIPNEIKHLVHGLAYPRVNIDTMAMEFYIEQKDAVNVYQELLKYESSVPLHEEEPENEPQATPDPIEPEDQAPRIII